jgi:hypothetical protein
MERDDRPTSVPDPEETREQLARRFRAEAGSKGIALDPIPWPEDAGCDLIVRRIDE